MTAATALAPEVLARIVESISAVHEAGHAVVAAYLRVPFKYATLDPTKEEMEPHVSLPNLLIVMRSLSYNKKTDSFRIRSEDELQQEICRRLQNHAVMILGARAAVDSFYPFFMTNSEECYQYDEEQLREYAKAKICIGGLLTRQNSTASLDIPDNSFTEWREKMLSRARQIVSIPYVEAAIRTVEYELIMKRKVSAPRVREILRQEKQYTAHTAWLASQEVRGGVQ